LAKHGRNIFCCSELITPERKCLSADKIAAIPVIISVGLCPLQFSVITYNKMNIANSSFHRITNIMTTFSTSFWIVFLIIVAREEQGMKISSTIHDTQETRQYEIK
jgi:hypothetical protein